MFMYVQLLAFCIMRFDLHILLKLVKPVEIWYNKDSG